MEMFTLLSFLQDINKEETLLEKGQSEFPILQTLIADKQPYEQLWTTAFNFQSMSEVWMNGRLHICFSQLLHGSILKALNSTINS